MDTVAVASSLRTVGAELVIVVAVVPVAVVEKGRFRSVVAVLEGSTFLVLVNGSPCICELSKLSSVYSSDSWLLPLLSSLLTDSSFAMSLLPPAVSSADQLPWADRSETDIDVNVCIHELYLYARMYVTIVCMYFYF